MKNEQVQKILLKDFFNVISKAGALEILETLDKMERCRVRDFFSILDKAGSVGRRNDFLRFGLIEPNVEQEGGAVVTYYKLTDKGRAVLDIIQRLSDLIR